MKRPPIDVFAKLGRVLIASGALIFIGGLGITIIESVVWFQTGRVPTMFQDILWGLPTGLTALMTGAAIGVTGALVLTL
jgi:hypothetical protein